MVRPGIRGGRAGWLFILGIGYQVLEPVCASMRPSPNIPGSDQVAAADTGAGGGAEADVLDAPAVAPHRRD